MLTDLNIQLYGYLQTCWKKVLQYMNEVSQIECGRCFLLLYCLFFSEDDGTKREAFGTNSSEKIFPLVKFTRENERNDHRCLRNKTTFLHTCSQCSEEQVMPYTFLKAV